MILNSSKVRAMLLGGAAVLALAGAARADDRARFDIPPQSLETALKAFSVQSHQPLLFTPDLTDSKVSPGVSGAEEVGPALGRVLNGTGLTYRRSGDTFLIVRAAEGRLVPQKTANAAVSVAGDAGGSVSSETNVVQELVVTAQKREEAIQTVPIAISAFTQKTLEEQHIEGGFDLLKAIPNVTFSKNNFTGYNFSIRGIGTKAISATTDPGVAVAFNNSALIQNRLFEQEYFDIERVEVLRGPQGTLYGRNATAGVINVISAKPTDHFEGSIKAEVGNYQSRRASGFLNIPIIGDKLGVRLAGSFTERDGYDFNSITGHAINGRNLWSGRLTVGFKPFERLRGNFIWEHFDEDDNRSRTGKQLCHRDPGPEKIGDTSLAGSFGDTDFTLLREALFSQGCKPGSLYDDSAFGTPNGLAVAPVYALLALQLGGIMPLAAVDGGYASLLKMQDPYQGAMQSRDLRTVASIRDPQYRAKADVFELNVDFDLGRNLTLTAQTAYDKDQVYSSQDFNRFNTAPIFNDTSKFHTFFDENIPSGYENVAPGGVFCDPQLGCSNRLAGFDLSQGKSTQFNQEVRLQSDFAGPVNFSLGANYTRFKVLIDYYVFYNILTDLAMSPPLRRFDVDHPADINVCYLSGFGASFGEALPTTDPRAACPYIDPNPLESINGEGHNYFRSENPYKLQSAAVFGETYWQIRPDVKITAGLRYTDDRKTFTPIPSQVLLSRGIFGGGTVNRGYPSKADIKQQWGEFTGRLGVDWKPDLSFTDATMIYAFYSRGYKGGGANPPSPGFANREEAIQQAREMGLDEALIGLLDSLKAFPTLTLSAVEYGPTFKPEFVNAFEVGAKNTLLGGAMTLNADAFFYDYKDYQVSQIRDRTAVNENFDAKVWGLEFETRFVPSRNLQIIGNLGYLDTRIGDGMKSIDIMNRTQGKDWVIAKPWFQYPSNCIIPARVAESWAQTHQAFQNYWSMCGALGGLVGALAGNTPPIDPLTGEPFRIADYPEANGGAGFFADLGGNELPNSPHWTANLGAQYGFDFAEGWRATLRGDAYWQSQSWARVYNDDPYDKLHGWYNLNLSLSVERPDDGLKIEIYVKNLLDGTPITDAFLNSDDSALTTNVFTLDPRLIGFSVTKTF